MLSASWQFESIQTHNLFVIYIITAIFTYHYLKTDKCIDPSTQQNGSQSSAIPIETRCSTSKKAI